ncbi:hypothetical protein Ahy_B08g090248 [Arachis hypogaea]|uniref:DUF659 domain-containing protein n=1 Tax=Arachis hypogaea TaxID=3818 RepID=A0A444XZU6_ARAHY|nr:hypothetical protein Ahy_B08g090248 [Arachis hypogaea]
MQGSKNQTGPAGSIGLTVNRRCKRSGPPLITVGEKTAKKPVNRLKIGCLSLTVNPSIPKSQPSSHRRRRGSQVVSTTAVAWSLPTFIHLSLTPHVNAEPLNPSPLKHSQPSSPPSSPRSLGRQRHRHRLVLSTAASSSLASRFVFAGLSLRLRWSSLCQHPVMENSINQEATADNNASVNNNMLVDPPISNDDAANPNSRSANDSQSEVFNGGGIHRMKKHLAKITGNVKKCPKVPYDVEKQMESLLKEIQTNKKKRKVSFGEEGGDEVEDAIDEEIAQEEQEQQRTSRAQPSIKSVLQNKEAIHEVDKRFARWLLDCKIPFNAVMSPFFQDMLDGVAGIGPGYKGPSYDKLRVHLLADLKRESKMLVDSYRSAWKETGCTLMADGWTDQRQRTLINFLVYCSKGLCFVKDMLLLLFNF